MFKAKREYARDGFSEKNLGALFAQLEGGALGEFQDLQRVLARHGGKIIEELAS